MLRDPWHCEGNATGKGSCQTGTMYYGTCLRALLRNTFYMDLQSAAVFPDVLYVAITYFMRYLSRSTGVYGVVGQHWVLVGRSTIVARSWDYVIIRSLDN